jgi:hypothetical protein
MVEIATLLSSLPDREGELTMLVLSPLAVAAAEVLHKVNVWKKDR